MKTSISFTRVPASIWYYRFSVGS